MIRIHLFLLARRICLAGPRPNKSVEHDLFV